jgi:ABC-2 type transport system ATP-binding protein
MTTPVVVDDITRRFGRIVAVDRVSFTIQPGEVLGLLGPNGAGKTTTMRLMTGYLRPHSGRVMVGDLDVARDGVAARRLIGYLPESAAVPRELTVGAYLRYCTRLRGVPRGRRADAVDAAVEQAGLRRVAHQVIGTLSKGFRQRVGLAQALVHDPPVLVLDEPTIGLDPRQVAETRALLGRLGKRRTVLLSSHLLGEISALCKRVVIIDGGRVAATTDLADLAAAAGRRRVEVRVSGDVEAAVRSVRGLAGVETVSTRGALLIVHGDGADLAERVSTALVGAGHGLSELNSSTESLEDAYLRIVRQ